MKTVIFSHGFGVKADSRGMFPKIADKLDGCKFVMFDYNKVDAKGDTTVFSLEDQAKILQSQIDRHIGEKILIGHSQGCVVIGLLADLSNIDKVILLAPPDKTSKQFIIERFASKKGSVIDLNGTSTLARSDGTFSYITKEYMNSIGKYNPMELYQNVANTVPTLIIRATGDDVIGMTNVDQISDAKHVDIDSSHNFSGDSNMASLINEVAKFID